MRTTWPRVLWIGGGVLLVVMLGHIAALLITRGAVTGPISLRKPATFAESGWLVAWSVALILPWLRTRAWQRHVIGGSVLLFGYVETTVIGIQAWRGVPSHYNFTTPFDAALMRGGAAGTAGVFVVGMIVLLVASLRSPDSPASVRLGVRAGIVLLLVGCAVGLVMVFNNSGVFQGTVGAGFSRQASGYLGPDAVTVGREYVLLRPHTRGGDLVAPHAIGIHGLLLLAVPAVLLTRTTLTPVNQLKIVLVSVVSVAAAMAVLLVQALRQSPLDQLGPVWLTVLAGCALALAASFAGTAVALLRVRAG